MPFCLFSFFSPLSFFPSFPPFPFFLFPFFSRFRFRLRGCPNSRGSAYGDSQRSCLPPPRFVGPSIRYRSTKRNREKGEKTRGLFFAFFPFFLLSPSFFPFFPGFVFGSGVAPTRENPLMVTRKGHVYPLPGLWVLQFGNEAQNAIGKKAKKQGGCFLPFFLFSFFSRFRFRLRGCPNSREYAYGDSQR